MAEFPLVSVLMTVRDAQKTVGLAIESILSQTLSDFEFLIIDDASTDQTWPILESYQLKDKRISIFRNESRLGISANRNKLVSLTKTDFIAWQDADDISFINRLEKQLNFLKSKPAVGICGGWLLFFNEDKNIGLRQYPAADNILRKRKFRYSPAAQPAAMLRKEAVVKAGGFKENLVAAEDLDLSFRIGENYEFANLAEPILRYRQSKNSITFKKLRDLEINTIKIRLNNRKNSAYQFSLIDFLYNFFQAVTIFIFSAKIRISLFNFFRNNH